MNNSLEVIKSLSQEQANGLLGNIVEIHNQLISDRKECGWVGLGILIERLSGRVRQDMKPSEPALPPPGSQNE